MASPRLFFAALPDPEVRAHLACAAAGLEFAGARAVPAGQYHLTLAFLGAVDPVRLAAVRAVGAAQRAAAFELHFDRWQYWREQAVIVAVPREVPVRLIELRSRLAAALTGARLEFDDKPFLPHVTVVKKVVQASVLPQLDVLAWRASSYSLVASAPHSSGSAYTVIDTWPLLDTRANI